MVHYINFYGTPDNPRNLNFATACVSKVEYLWRVMNQAGFQVSNVSVCWTKNRFFCAYRKQVLETDDRGRQIYFSTFGAPVRLFRGAAVLWSKFQLCFYLLFQVKRSDTVLFYHSPFYLPLLNLIRRIRGFRLVAEVEEIYAAAKNQGAAAQNREISALQQADAFYLVNDLMASRCGFGEKPCWVSYGNYHIPEREHRDFGDGRIHAVYAGVVEEIKRGAFIAVETAEFLPGNYCVDILDWVRTTA